MFAKFLAALRSPARVARKRHGSTLVLPVLTYHAGNVAGPDYLGNDHEALAADLAMLARQGWKVVPLDWVVEQRLGLAKRDLARCVALTCDDGTDLDVRDVDYPGLGHQRSFLGILQDAQREFGERLGHLHMTSFVIADPATRASLDRDCLHNLGWMNEDWWRDAHASGLMAIECHSWDHNHPVAGEPGPYGMGRGDFFQVDTAERAAFEIDQAVSYLNARIAPAVTRYFGYPYGHVNEFLSKHYLPGNAARLGLRAGFGTQGGPVTMASDPWNLPRFVCGWQWKSPQELEALLNACAAPA